jgi:formimidoylglutamate deiminase
MAGLFLNPGQRYSDRGCHNKLVTPVTILHASRVLMPDGWAEDTDIVIDAAGRVVQTAPGAGIVRPAGVLLPGIPNVHSHAFQRALAGRTERAGGPDTFRAWRERMYELAHRVTPEDLEAIATLVYVEMLEAGYTAVAEFHYLHHGPGGARHADPAAASRALLAAAARAGIRLTLLPVLYEYGGFGARPPARAQAPFVQTVREYLALLETLCAERNAAAHIGIAFHSLRAVSPAAMEAVLAWRAGALPRCPVHIHVAEQAEEVQDCESWSGRRPVEWLLERGWVDEHWCLVHATHVTAAETHALAGSGAVVGLCPTTAANLGDGIFPLDAYLAAGGRIAIGSDSHVSVSPVEELRWLEYVQRLVHGRRNVAASDAQPHTGTRLVRAALAGGSRALGIETGVIAPGAWADLIELDLHDVLFAGAPREELLDRWVFAGNRPLVANVWVGGRQVVRNGRHPLAADAAEAFAEVMRSLVGDEAVAAGGAR